MSEEKISRWSKAELELIRNTFGGEEGEKLLLQVRNVLFQFDVEVPELSVEVLQILRKMILPPLSPDLPIGLQASLRNALTSIKDINPEAAYLHIKANDIVYDFLEQQLMVLEGIKDDREKIVFEYLVSDGADDKERFVNMMAYLFLENSYIDGSIQALKNLANEKEETDEERKARILKDSSK